MNGYGTPFVETEALLAVQQSNFEEARRIIEGMLPSERDNLGRAASCLHDIIRQMRFEDGLRRIGYPHER
jgi:hypothetical protein